MSTRAASRRSSSSSAAAKRPAMAEGAKAAGTAAAQAKKRAALGNITNVVAAPAGRAAALGKVAPPVTGAVHAALSLCVCPSGIVCCAVGGPFFSCGTQVIAPFFSFSDPGVLALGWAGSRFQFTASGCFPPGFQLNQLFRIRVAWRGSSWSLSFTNCNLRDESRAFPGFSFCRFRGSFVSFAIRHCSLHDCIPFFLDTQFSLGE